MGKAMIRMHVLREFATLYEKYRVGAGSESIEVMVPIKLLRMAHEIIEENDNLKVEK